VNKLDQVVVGSKDEMAGGDDKRCTVLRQEARVGVDVAIPGQTKGNDLIINFADLKPRKLCLELNREDLVTRLANLE
jgi:hypothetical protein